MIVFLKTARITQNPGYCSKILGSTDRQLYRTNQTLLKSSIVSCQIMRDGEENFSIFGKTLLMKS